MSIKYVAYLRHLAHAEARSLRHLHRSHGHLPATRPLAVDPDEFARWKLEQRWLRARRKGRAA